MSFNKIACLIICLGGIGVAQAGVRVETLPALTMDEIGVVTPFPADIWAGQAGDEVAQTIRTVGRLSLSIPERQVLRDLLMTDVSGAINVQSGNGAFLAARIEALINQGLFEDVFTLLNQVPDGQKTADMKRWRKEAQLGLGQNGAACAEPEMGDWGQAEAEMRVVCSFLNGTEEQATLAFDVYREETHGEDWIVAAGYRYFRQMGSLPDKGIPSIRSASMVAEAYGEIALTKEWTPGMFRAVALNPKVHPDVRVLAAERGEVSAMDWQSVLSSVGQDSGNLKRVRLFLDMMHRPLDGHEKEASDLIHELRRENVFKAWSPALTGIALALRPQVALAGDILPVLIRANERERAQAWYDILYAAHPEQALMFAVGLNAIGGGVPDNIDALVTTCVSDQTCHRMLRGVPFYFPVSSDVVASVPISEPEGYAGFVTAAVQRQMEQGNIGGALLNALSLLARSDAVERPLIQVIAQAVPQGVSDAILRERVSRGY